MQVQLLRHATHSIGHMLDQVMQSTQQNAQTQDRDANTDKEVDLDRQVQTDRTLIEILEAEQQATCNTQALLRRSLSCCCLSL